MLHGKSSALSPNPKPQKPYIRVQGLGQPPLKPLSVDLRLEAFVCDGWLVRTDLGNGSRFRVKASRGLERIGVAWV